MNDNIPIINEEKYLHDLHMVDNLAMGEEKGKDKFLTKEENYLLVVFDLQNVLTLSKVDVGCFFYKKSLPSIRNDFRKTRLLCSLDGM